MHLTLINPPQFRPFHPPLGIGILCAMAKKHGVSVNAVDVNLMSYEHFLSPQALATGCDEVVKGLDRLEGRITLDYPAQQHYHRLARALRYVDNPEKIRGDALRVFGDVAAFCEYGEYRKAFFRLNGLLEMSTARFHPSLLNLMEIRLPIPAHRTVPELADFAKEDGRNPYLEWFSDFFAERLEPTMPEGSAVGISLVHPTQFLGALTIAWEIRRKRKDIKIIAGGPAVTTMIPEIIAEKSFHRLFDAFDALVRGEAEESFPVLLEALENGAPLENLPNTVCRDNGGRIVSGEETRPADLRSVPTPDFSGLPLERYLSPETVFPLQLSRGCHWGRCVFCDYDPGGPTVRLRPVEYVMRDISALKAEYGARYFFFTDSGVPPRHLIELSEALVTSRIDVRWSCFCLIRPELDGRAAGLLEKAGCRRLMFGVESAVPRILKKIKKGVSVKTASETLDVFAKAGIPPHIFLIFGFPGESREESEITLNFLKKRRRSIYSVSVELFTLNRRAALFKNHPGIAPPAGTAKTLIDPFTTHCDSAAYETASGRSYEETRLEYPAFAEKAAEILNSRRASYWPLHDLIYFSNRPEGRFPPGWDMEERGDGSPVTPRDGRLLFRQSEKTVCRELAYDAAVVEKMLEAAKDAVAKTCCGKGISMEQAWDELKSGLPEVAGSGCLVLCGEGEMIVLGGFAADLWRAFRNPASPDSVVRALKRGNTGDGPGHVGRILDLLINRGFLAPAGSVAHGGTRIAEREPSAVNPDAGTI